MSNDFNLKKAKDLVDVLAGKDSLKLTYVDKMAQRLSEGLLRDYIHGVPLEQAQRNLFHEIRKISKLTNQKTIDKIMVKLNILIKEKGKTL